MAMLFCQLAQAHSLREICDGLASCLGKLIHLGVLRPPKKSTLAHANQHRPWQVYQTVFEQLLAKCRAVVPRQRKFRFRNKLYSLDSSFIDLCLSLFDWARFRQIKGAVKLHLLLDHDGYLPSFLLITDGKHHDVRVAQNLHLPAGSIVAMDRGYNDYRLFSRWTEEGVYFVTRMKANAAYRVVERRQPPQNSGVICDQIIELTVWKARQDCPHRLRRIRYRDPDA